jgi:hypothetical protein
LTYISFFYRKGSDKIEDLLLVYTVVFQPTNLELVSSPTEYIKSLRSTLEEYYIENSSKFALTGKGNLLVVCK